MGCTTSANPTTLESNKSHTRNTSNTPLFEAPASVNLKVLIAGHEVMVTLRGADEGALLTRLDALLKRQDVRPIPKPVKQAGSWKQRGR